jgi:hypothetical protein
MRRAGPRLRHLFRPCEKDAAMKSRPATLPARAALPVPARAVAQPAAGTPVSAQATNGREPGSRSVARFQYTTIRGIPMAGS